MKRGRYRYTVPIAIGIIAVFVVLAIFFSNYRLVVEDSKENLTEISDIPLVTGAQTGNLVEINYVLSITEDSKVVDTNNKEIAEKWEIKNYVSGHFRFILGKSGKIKGFDGAITGMEKGEKKTVIIPPSTLAKEETIPMVQYFKRKIELPRFIVVSKEMFESTFSKKPVLNLMVNRKDAPWLYKVIDMTDTRVALEALVNEGDDVVIPGQEWKSKVLIVQPKSIVFVQNPKDGQQIKTDYGTAVITVATSNLAYNHTPELGKEFNKRIDVGTPLAPTERYFVKEINTDSFVIRKANFLEQEELRLEVELLSIEEI